jgi:hypothetical protein
VTINGSWAPILGDLHILELDSAHSSMILEYNKTTELYTLKGDILVI